ncbi:MAG: hypothetical protein ACOH2H_21060 [Cypionkella sp.]
MKLLNLQLHLNPIKEPMKIALRGRIVLWEGASLCAFDMPPMVAARRSTDFQSLHVIQITLAINGSFGFHIGAEVIDGPVVVIAPDVWHAYEPLGRNAMLFVEPESKAGAAILRARGGRKVARLDLGKFDHITSGLACI